MTLQRSIFTQSLLSALTVLSTQTFAQTQNEAITMLPEITVTATPFRGDEHAQILAPAKVLSGDELRNKQGCSLGDTLSHELGVSASAFGAAASRPIIRGLEGSRIKILQNGMSVSDVSSLSNDHAVASDVSSARQIEILRGPAALLYGSGAIGGLINIVNDRIPTELEPVPTGEAEVRYSTVDKGKHLSLSLDGAAGPIGLHIDGNVLNTDDYTIPNSSALNNPSSASGTLPHSFTHENNIGIGASYIEKWGHIGASVSELNNRYGVPTIQGSQIDQTQRRYDIDALIKKPFASFETFKFKLGYTDYKHSELDLTNVPQVNFANASLESRWELTHKPLAGWHGAFGIQTDNTKFSALSAANGSPDTVPETKSTSYAGFLVEERDFGPVHVNAGIRLESVDRRPVTGIDRSFHLTSYSIGGLWSFTPQYGLGATVSIAQRAPGTEELYANGPHDATATFDKGNANFDTETSRNIELTLQKTKGVIRWKTNLFQNRVKNFVYGQLTGTKLDEDGNTGGTLNERIFSQADATIQGIEAEVSYNLHKEGLSLRGFADASQGKLDNGSLPLQPATRFGVDAGYKQGAWRSGLSVVRAIEQNRLAAFETTTPAYTQVDMNLSYTQRVGSNQITWFALAKNLLNQDIRLSTSVLKDVAPLPGRSFIVGVRTRF